MDATPWPPSNVVWVVIFQFSVHFFFLNFIFFRAVFFLLVHTRYILPEQFEQGLSSPATGMLCKKCYVKSGSVTRVGLVKCGLSGWARLGHSLLNRCKVNIYSNNKEYQSPCSAERICIHTSAFGSHGVSLFLVYHYDRFGKLIR